MSALRALLLIPLAPILLLTLVADGIAGAVNASTGFTRAILNAVLGITS